MMKVAVTGGIGSGKSVVCSVFNKMGIPVFNADFEAKQIVNYNETIKQKLIALFGADIYQQNGTIHRKKLADIIFNDKIALQNVNAIIHPAVYKAFQNWANIQKAPFVIQEAAIVFENGHTDRFDKIITVAAPIELKVERCIKRDGISKELVLERMKNQLPDDYKIEHSDFVVVNDNKQMILPQIIEIYNKLV